MMSSQANALTPAGRLRYGLLGLPLAFVALPLYVHLPHLYASRYGMSLASLGAVLLLSRVFDALCDPLLGHWSDHLAVHSPQRLRWASGLAALVLLLGMTLLFFPPWPMPGQTSTLMTTLVLTCLAYSLLAIAHQSWGARLGGEEVQRARIVAWREGAGLVGVVLASVLPAWMDWDGWLGVFAFALGIAWWAWAFGPMPDQLVPVPNARMPLLALSQPWRQAAFRRLMLVFVLSGMANAIPATLVIFFVQDRLGAPDMQPVFLVLYFTAAAASMPLWLHLVTRLGLARSWLAGMVLSVMVFAWAAALGQGDVLPFGLVCALSGLALGADLALPGAMLAGHTAQHVDHKVGEGAYFGWWNLAGKLNLALAAGLTLPLLQWWGYQPGSPSEAGLQALCLAYAVLPCTLKLLAALALSIFLAKAP